MQIAPQVILSEPPNPDVDIRLREFAHRLAKTHEVATAKISRPEETSLLDYLQSWELALRNAICNLQIRASQRMVAGFARR